MRGITTVYQLSNAKDSEMYKRFVQGFQNTDCIDPFSERCTLFNKDSFPVAKTTFLFKEQGRQCSYNVTLRRVRVTFAVKKSIKFSECVSVALVSQLARRMRRVI
jgi:hypothetical protein